MSISAILTSSLSSPVKGFQVDAKQCSLYVTEINQILKFNAGLETHQIDMLSNLKRSLMEENIIKCLASIDLILPPTGSNVEGIGNIHASTREEERRKLESELKAVSESILALQNIDLQEARELRSRRNLIEEKLDAFVDYIEGPDVIFLPENSKLHDYDPLHISQFKRHLDVWESLVSLGIHSENSAPLVKFAFHRFVALEIFDYFSLNKSQGSSFDILQGDGLDPYLSLKRNEIADSATLRISIAKALPKLIELSDSDTAAALKTSLFVSIFGDAIVDMDNEPPLEQDYSSPQQLNLIDKVSALQKNLLLDQSDIIIEALLQKRSDGKHTSERTISIVVEEIRDLVGDLLLGHIFLLADCCDKVVYHCKAYPVGTTCTARDIYGILGFLSDPSQSDIWAMRHFGDVLSSHVIQGRISIEPNFYWNEPSLFSEKDIPRRLKDSLLAIFKGDDHFSRIDFCSLEPLGEGDSKVCCARRIRHNAGRNMFQGISKLKSTFSSGQYGCIFLLPPDNSLI